MKARDKWRASATPRPLSLHGRCGQRLRLGRDSYRLLPSRISHTLSVRLLPPLAFLHDTHSCLCGCEPRCERVSMWGDTGPDSHCNGGGAWGGDGASYTAVATAALSTLKSHTAA